MKYLSVFAFLLVSLCSFAQSATSQFDKYWIAGSNIGATWIEPRFIFDTGDGLFFPIDKTNQSGKGCLCTVKREMEGRAVNMECKLGNERFAKAEQADIAKYMQDGGLRIMMTYAGDAKGATTVFRWYCPPGK